MHAFKARAVRFLRWTESYTGTDMVYLTKGVSWLTSGQLVASAAAFILAIVLANVLPEEMYGQYKYILSLAAILGALSLAGFGPVITKAVRQGFTGILRDAVRMNILWSIPALLLGLGISVYYWYNENTLLSTSMFIVALLTPVFSTAQLYIWFLNGVEDFRRIAIFSAVTSAAQVASLLLAVWLHMSVPFIILAYFLSISCATVVCYLLTIHRYGPLGASDPHSLRFGLRLSAASFFGVLAANLDKILLFHFLGAVPVAIFALAEAPVAQLRSLLKVTTPLALPRLASQDAGTMYKTLQSKVWRLTIFTGTIVILYILAAPFLFSIFFPKYTESVIYSQVYALLLLLFPKKLTALGLLARDKTRESYVLSMITPGVQTVLIFALIPFIGIWGAIIAELTGSLAHYILSNYYFARAARYHDERTGGMPAA